MATDKITPEEVEHVASLAKLALTEADKEAFTRQLDKIFGLVDTLDEVDTTNVKPTYTVTDLTTALRDDVAVPANETQKLLANAPETQENLIKVPAILNAEEEN
ncbi:hypothetical protein IV73_GL000676 [Weissella kandleri]|uniref:Aspartyl/glutamyl-tRNA(Asn/Gln) amidotransferase subunit C n=1 Tax=Weissella kandleri TaxID=1616 RepID=A0A0R2JDR7_9LACO|nr:Asp-tRNA(Asn)/Glu-tRNA(Gln) amidotransferase subunit GatC [Weissella kandleri]KRN75506.1 hypothetical protein IV73_GL000676 [Weissella kandleri]